MAIGMTLTDALKYHDGNLMCLGILEDGDKTVNATKNFERSKSLSRHDEILIAAPDREIVARLY